MGLKNPWFAAAVQGENGLSKSKFNLFGRNFMYVQKSEKSLSKYSLYFFYYKK